MADYTILKTSIRNVVKTNANNEITGLNLQQTLLGMVNSLGAGFQFMGVATTDMNPGTPDQNVFYLAGPGTYTQFGAITIPTGYIGVLKWNGSWTYSTMSVSSSVGGASWGETTSRNYAQLTVDTDSRLVALNGHTQPFSTVLENVSGTKQNGVVVQWDSSLNNNQGGWKYAVVSGSGVEQVQSNWTETDPNSKAFILNKPTLATVATSGNYNDLLYKPDLSAYLKFKGWAGAVNANDLLLGSWVHSNSMTQNPTDFGAIIAFGCVDNNSGPAQLEINQHGVPYTRIRWNGTWGTWHEVVLCDRNQEINDVKTFNAQTVFVGGISSGHILPRTDATYNLGSWDNSTQTGLQWDNAYIKNGLFLNGKNVFQYNAQANAFLVAYGFRDTAPTNFYATQWNFRTYIEAEQAESVVLSVYQSSVRCRVTLMPKGNADTDIGAPSESWRYVYARRWYPTNSTAANAPYLGYDSQVPGFYLNGNLVVNGQISTDTDFAEYYDMTAPDIRIISGSNSLGQAMQSTMKISHPLLYDDRLDAKPVLMIWGKRRGRNHESNPAALKKIEYCAGRWGEARGKYATNTPFIYTVRSSYGVIWGARYLSDLRTFVLQHYVCGIGYSRVQMESMTLATFESLSSGTFRFGGKHGWAGTIADFKKKTKAVRVFGVAIRYTNPRFLEVWDGTSALAETTRELTAPNGDKVPRYIYTEVTPFMMDCHVVGDNNGGEVQTLGIQMQPISAPHS